ncbi:hypothetical protein ACFRQM_49840 [Streptomyces sp. NPDC056831]|uniref:hypothetical protein n=1 Tax=Streptomyces sp. NPDC056831 TaxID=3345954 RepID=UPI0036C94084
MTALTDPLTEEQRLLLDIAWTTFVEHERFPNFFHVAYRMRKHGHDAAKVLYSFPVIGHDQVSNGYRAVGWWGHGYTPQSDGPVYLTMAGLYHLQHDQMARDLARGLLAYMQQMTWEQDKILDSPFDLPNIDVNLGDVLKEIAGAGPLVERMAQIADREWPGIRFNKTTLTGQLGALPAADCDTLDLYLPRRRRRPPVAARAAGSAVLHRAARRVARAELPRRHLRADLRRSPGRPAAHGPLQPPRPGRRR